MIQDIAASKGNQFSYETSTPGGYQWAFHTELDATVSKIDAGTYDYMILQEQSVKLANVRSGFAKHQHWSFPEADLLNHRSKVSDICRKTMFYMTWGRKDGNGIYLPFSPYGQSYEEMQDHLTENYLELAEVMEAEVAPVGEAWRKVLNDYPQIELYNNDGSHPSLAGTYLAACVFYTAIFHKSVAGAWKPSSLSAVTAQQLRSVADQTVVGSWADWNIDTSNPPCSATLVTNNQQWSTVQVDDFFGLSEVHFTSNQHGYVKGEGPMVWQTNDAGDSWQSVSMPAESAYNVIDDKAFDIFYVDQNIGWLVVNAEEIDSSTLIQLPFEGSSADYVSYLRVFKTSDGGTTWQESGPERGDFEIMGSGILDSRPAFLDFHLMFDNTLKGTMTCRFGINNDTTMYTFGTDDGGLTWDIVQDTLSMSTADLWFKDASVAYKSGKKDHTHLNSDPQKIFRTEDRGVSWSEIANLYNNCCEIPFSTLQHHFSAFRTVGEDTLLAVNSLFVPTFYRSVDGGDTWDSIKTIDIIGTVSDIIQPTGNIYYTLFSGKVNRIMASYDLGVNWKLEAYFPEHLSAAALTDKYIYVVGARGTIHRKRTALISSNGQIAAAPQSFQLFPNPASDQIYLREIPPNTPIIVRNILGVIVKQLHSNETGQAHFELTGFPKGVYFISVPFPREMATKRVVLVP